jgi:glucose/mannose transport system permease protein
MSTNIEPSGLRPHRLTVSRLLVYATLIVAACTFLVPLYVMIVTSLKPMSEIRLGNILALPAAPSVDAWIEAWTSACTGLTCNGIRVGFWNSAFILVPSVVASIVVGAINGYALAFWKLPGAGVLFGALLVGAFVPYPVFIYPLVRIFAWLGIYGTLPGIVLIHTIFGLPVMTILFRNYYASLPLELFKAARIDGAGFVRVFVSIMLPMSIPILVVAVILQVTGIWNDFLLGLIFAGRENMPMTVQLNNVVNSSMGERNYNVEMAATMLTALVPLAVYFLSGKWFVRGIAAGAVKS